MDLELELCRLCLTQEDLGPIFVDLEQSRSYSTVLELTTGLDIKLNDGLPQKICSTCTDAVNKALELRNNSQNAELQLFSRGYKRIKLENPDNEKNKIDETILEGNSENYAEHVEIENYDTEFEIKVECNRLSDKHKPETDNKLNLSEDKLPQDPENRLLNVTNNKTSRKERHAKYLSMVEGELNRNGPVKCNICKKTVANWASFLSHVKLHLGFDFVCESCGKSFVSTTQLTRHRRAHHGENRALQCSLCHYLALDNRQLVLHVRRVHTGERPFVCATCGGAYHSRRCLIQHIETHETDATVQCPRCPSLFKSRRHLARHTYTAHTSKLYNYVCPVCRQMYRNGKYARVHLRKVHGLSSRDVSVVKVKI